MPPLQWTRPVGRDTVTRRLGTRHLDSYSRWEADSAVQSDQQTLQMLQQGEISSPQLTPQGSNYTFMVDVTDGAQGCKAVYKPRDGEAPLWDFPDGTLYKREYAAYLLSQILEWDFIPTTVMRDGPYGVGSLQLCIDHDPRANYYYIRQSNPDPLRMIACYDLVTNNADRKPSHCIQDDESKVWGIDHGLTFHSVLKVMTVIWDFGHESIPGHLLADLVKLQDKLERPEGPVKELLGLITQDETGALRKRVEWLLEKREYPGLDGHARWDQIPFGQ